MPNPVRIGNYIAQAHNAALEQERALDAARAAGHDVFGDSIVLCDMDYSAIELRLLNHHTRFALLYGCTNVYDFLEQQAITLKTIQKASLDLDIAMFEMWQDDANGAALSKNRKENAAIAYAAVEAGIAWSGDWLAPVTAVQRAPYDFTGVADSDAHMFWHGSVTGRYSSGKPLEEESDLERDRR